MYKNKKILAIIPARGGSKRLPRKNIKKLAGKPLISYSIEHAKASRYISRFLVSTDDKKIKQVAQKWQSEVMDRPAHLAKDKTSTEDVVLHVLDKLRKKENYRPDIVLCLPPTSPLRKPEDIDNAINLFIKEKEAQSLVSITEFEHSPVWSFKLREDKYLEQSFTNYTFQQRTQDLPEMYRPNGSIFISRPSILSEHKTFYTANIIAYKMPRERSVDIDNKIDFVWAEFLINQQNK